MKYLHILSAFAAEPWAIAREKLDAITSFLLFQAGGGKYTPEEVAAKITDRKAVKIAERPGGVAVIPIYGVLAQRMDMMSEISGGTSYQSILAAVHAAVASDEVKAIILDIDSPGGAVPGATELAAELRALRGGDKPIIAVVNSLSASAAYWIASSADEVVVTPSGRGGSIGVYTSHDDISEYLKLNGIKRTYIAAGKYKVEGNEAEPLEDDTKGHIAALVQQSYDRFVDDVAEGRGVTRTRVLDDFGQGRVFGAKELLQRGMADRIATIDQTISRFGGATEPEVVRRVKAANAARADAAVALIDKFKAGQPVTKREFENGIKGLGGLSNSEAERAARLYLKDGQGEPDEADSTVNDALRKLKVALDGFSLD